MLLAVVAARALPGAARRQRTAPGASLRAASGAASTLDGSAADVRDLHRRQRRRAARRCPATTGSTYRLRRGREPRRHPSLRSFVRDLLGRTREPADRALLWYVPLRAGAEPAAPGHRRAGAVPGALRAWPRRSTSATPSARASVSGRARLAAPTLSASSVIVALLAGRLVLAARRLRLGRPKTA